KIHESVNVNFDEISEMASKQFSLEPGLSNLNKKGKSSNPLVSQVSETSKKDLEDLFHNFYDAYFDSSKIMKSSTMNVETSINEEVFHEVSESFQGESSSSLNDDVQQSPEEDAYFDASTSFHDPSNVHTFYQPYPHEKKWTKDHPLHKIIVEALKDADWVSAMQEELDQFARLKIWNTVPIPMVEQAKLKLNLVGKPVDHTDYRSMIGSLMYVTSGRPDIIFATCMCARYQENLNEHHVSDVKRIFRYLKGTINLGLWYLKDSGFDLTAYSDADHARCHLDRKCTSQSEYVAVSSCCAQVLWMRTQLTDYGFFYDKLPIYYDSKSAIAISCNLIQVAQKKVKIAFENADSSSRVELIPSKIKYANKMSRDVLTVGSTIRIPLLYRGEYSQWVERFMNYLEEQTDGEAMTNSIMTDKSMWSDQEKKIQKIDSLARSLLIQGLLNDIYSLIDSNRPAKDLWDALARHMIGSEYGEQDRKAAVLYEYETFKSTEGELFLDTYIRYIQVINDLKKCGYSKDNCELNFKFLNNLQPEWKQRKIVVVTSDPLALIAEKTKVNKSKEKVVVSSDSVGSGADNFNELKKITALLAKAFNQRKFYSKPTNNNLRTSSTSQSAHKKQEFVKSYDKKVEKKDDEKKRDMSKVKCYNCKKEGHFAKDCKKDKVKDYNNYKTMMLLAKKESDEKVLLVEDQACMESSSYSDKEINANMVFMAQIERVLSDLETSSSFADEKISEVSYYLSESESESGYETSEYCDNTTTYGLFVNHNDDQEIFHECENFPENIIESQIDHNESVVDRDDSKGVDKCYLLNDYEDVGKLKAKGDIGVFVRYSKESAAFRIYNKQTRKIHESVNVNFDEILEMASKQFSLEPGLSNLNKKGKSSNPSVLQVSETSKKFLEDLFHNFYDEYFDSSKIMKSSTTNVEL
nr:hypothetical protein [Tanacetum cinerariifolium]